MKKQAKKSTKSGVDYSKVLGGTLAGVGIVIIALLVAILYKELRDEKKYMISYRSDDKLAESIVEQSELDKNIVAVEVDDEVKTVDTSKYIKVEEALGIALESAGLTKDQVWDIDVELEQKFGQVVFEVSFDAGQYEYEYYINAENGEVVKSFKEIDR